MKHYLQLKISRKFQLQMSCDQITWEHVGHGGCTGGNWKYMGLVNSLEEAKERMLDDEECSQDQSMLFYSPFSFIWGSYCATAEHHDDCTENNENWQEYIFHISTDGPGIVTSPWLCTLFTPPALELSQKRFSMMNILRDPPNK